MLYTIMFNFDNRDYSNIYKGAKRIGSPRCLQQFAWDVQQGYKLYNPSFVFPITIKPTSAIMIIMFGESL
jgi:hypothetical protein